MLSGWELRFIEFMGCCDQPRCDIMSLAAVMVVAAVVDVVGLGAPVNRVDK